MDTLFHYTTTTGLLGILQDSKIWASDLRFLNDTKESVYARDMVINAVESMENPVRRPEHPAHQYGEPAADTFTRYHESTLDELKNSEFGVYIACFCESGDLLSQWRGYGGGQGYSIEIAKDGLRDAVKEFPAYPPATGLFKVKYGLEAASTVVEAAVQQVANFNLNHPGVKAHYSALAVSTLLAQVKHPGFSEEREWRLAVGLEIYDETRHDRQPTLYRSTPRAVVPYLKIPLKSESIVSIRVGPGDSAELRAGGIRRLLKTLGLNATVTHSEVPLRP
jgi:hypothetical protein